MMKDLPYKLAGRLSLLAELPRKLVGETRTRKSDEGLDRTGLVVQTPERLKVLWDDGDVIYPQYESFGQSFWRAQEFSLFRSHRNLLKAPVADFGCGDGSFASVIFDKIEYGVDIDDEALRLASGYGVYTQLVRSDDLSIPLPSGTVGSVFSNSVLEHLANLEAMLLEFHRILIRGGILMFTVPLKQYERDLAKFIGKRASRRFNYDAFHRNLFEVDEWRDLLQQHGFSVITLKPFQPERFTFWFRMSRLVGSRFGLAILFPHIQERLWTRFNSQIVGMVRESINNTVTGGNIFVIAKKC